MRIIAGSLRGRRLQGPSTDGLALRPTGDRAREALFSILETRPRGPFLDLFAGTGAVGLEAWSRGHAPVTCVESAPAALQLLRANIAGTGVQVLAADVRRLGPTAFQGLGLVFSDPPYAESAVLLERLAPAVQAWLAEAGWLVWECAAGTRLPDLEGLTRFDQRRYGAAAFHFFGRVGAEDRLRSGVQ